MVCFSLITNPYSVANWVILVSSMNISKYLSHSLNISQQAVRDIRSGCVVVFIPPLVKFFRDLSIGMYFSRRFIAVTIECTSPCEFATWSVSMAALMNSISSVTFGFCEVDLRSCEKTWRQVCGPTKPRSHMLEIYADINDHIRWRPISTCLTSKLSNFISST